MMHEIDWESKAKAASQVPISRIELERVTFAYEASRPLLNDVSISFEVGSVGWITGEAGSGQSTLLKILAVLVQPKVGSYWIDDVDIYQLSYEEFLPLRVQIGYSFDFGGLLANRTIQENLMLPIVYHKTVTREDTEERIRDWARRFRFESQLGERPAHVSGGLRKLICILRAILIQPKLLLMDDPFTGLDPKTRQELLVLLENERQTGSAATVLFTSNDEDWARRLCNKEVRVSRSARGAAS